MCETGRGRSNVGLRHDRGNESKKTTWGEERKDIGIDLSAVLLLSIGYKYSRDPTYIQFLYNLIHSSTIWLVFHQHKDNNGEYKFLYVTFLSAFCPSALMRMSRCRSDVLNQIKQSRVITTSEQVKWLALVKQLHIRKRSYCGNVDAFLTEATEVKWRFKPKCFPEPNQVFFLSKPNQTATVRHSSQLCCFLGYIRHFSEMLFQTCIQLLRYEDVLILRAENSA